MATLKKSFSSSDKVLAAYRDKTIIFLEGETDVTLFRNYWFRHRLDKLEFTKPHDGIGCKGVIQNVKSFRKNGIPAFGLVDRDTLQANGYWDLVWEINDLIFSRAAPYGPHIKITRYWEIESYLIVPLVIEAHICHFSDGRTPRPPLDAEEDCVAHAEALIPHAAMNAARCKNGEREFPDGHTSTFPTRATVESEFQKLKDAGHISDVTWKEYEKSIPKVEAFSIGTSPGERLTGLLRRINGKAILHRIMKKHKLQNNHTFILAESIRIRNAIPQDLKDFIDIFLYSR
jgi:hypothetical protein